MSTVFEVCALNNKLTDNVEDNIKLLSVDRPTKEKVYTTGGGSTTYRKLNCKNADKKSPLCLYYKADKVVEKKDDEDSENADKDEATTGPAVDKTKDVKKPIMVTKGIEDPNSEAAKKKRTSKDNDKADLTFETRLSKSGALGEAIRKIHPAFIRIIEDKNNLTDEKERIITETIEKKVDRRNPGGPMIDVVNTIRDIKGMLTTRYGSGEQTPIEFRGKLIEDPKIRWKLDFSRYPSSFGKLAGTPKSVVRDYTKPDGGSYRIARVDGKLIDKDNAHMVVTGGSLIHEIRLDYGSVAITDKYVTVHAHVCEMVIETLTSVAPNLIGGDGEVLGQLSIDQFNPEDRYDSVEDTSATTTTTTTTVTAAPMPGSSDEAVVILGAEIDKVLSM